MQQIFITEIVIVLCLWASNTLLGQQRYEGQSFSDCNIQAKDKSTSFLYTCTETNSSCKAFLIFVAQTPFDSVPSISKLTSADPSELAKVNNGTNSIVFRARQEVIVPVNCLCSGQFYMANSSYVLRTDDETYYNIATGTYQGLASCSSLVAANSFSPSNLFVGLKLKVPLRCACPSDDQTRNGIKYLLTYSVARVDNLFTVSKRFNISLNRTFEANMLSQQHHTILPSTTILIPLATEPSISQTKIRHQTMPSPPFSPTLVRDSRKGLKIIVGVATSCFLVVVCLVGLLFIAFFYLRKKKKANEINDQRGVLKGKNQAIPKSLLEDLASVEWAPKVYTMEELQEATGNFSLECKIGSSVYHGKVAGCKVAIRKTGVNVSREINILHKINHFNLIRLYGFCLGQENCYLIYEYMENGSLKDWLSNKCYSGARSWKQRIQIAVDIAKGLQYLHIFTQPMHVHRNVNSSTVLLDKDLRAKLADFGIARCAAKHDDNSIFTRHIEGTRGYMAPEYLEKGLVTPKIDIYAFGIVMLELITGKDAIIKEPEGEVLLSKAMISIVEDEQNVDCKLNELMDSSLCGAFHLDLASSVAKLSVACLRREPSSRPCIDEIVSTLSRILIESQRWECGSV